MATIIVGDGAPGEADRGPCATLLKDRTAPAIAGAIILLAGLPTSGWAAGTTERVSVGPGGAQANGRSSVEEVSGDGRFVAFDSSASNLVPGDTNSAFDVFVRDRTTRTTQRVSVGTAGRQANEASGNAAISADGRLVAFGSSASNLVPGDTNEEDDVFVRNLKFGTTRRASVSTGGAQGHRWSIVPVLSSDGRFVAFLSEAPNLVPHDTNGVLAPWWSFDVFVRDRTTRTTTRVNLGPRGVQADGSCGSLAISANGRFVAFSCGASNLVPGDTNGEGDVFVRDRWTRTTSRVSVGAGGVQADLSSGNAAISADGRFVAFESDATNLVPGDTNGETDVFVRTR